MGLQSPLSANRKFLTAFRCIARCYLIHRKAIKKLPPRYRYECPANCEKFGYNHRRRKKCEGCPLGEPERQFREQTLFAIEKMLGWRLAEKFDFDKLLGTLYAVIGFEDVSKEKLSVRNNQLLNVYLSERNYREELDDPEKKT